MVRMTKCITVSTAAEKERILNILVENNIPYRVKMDNVNQSISFSGFGGVNSVKISYTFRLTTLIISKKPGNTGISRDIRTEFTTDLLLSD